MFSESNLEPGQLLEIMWKMSCRTPSSLIPLVIFGKAKSEVYARIKYFRDVAGWYEDKNIPGPIHVDPLDTRKNTQTVERSHSSVKMRLRKYQGFDPQNVVVAKVTGISTPNRALHSCRGSKSSRYFNNMRNTIRNICPILQIRKTVTTFPKPL